MVPLKPMIEDPNFIRWSEYNSILTNSVDKYKEKKYLFKGFELLAQGKISQAQDIVFSLIPFFAILKKSGNNPFHFGGSSLPQHGGYMARDCCPLKSEDCHSQSIIFSIMVIPFHHPAPCVTASLYIV
jgi:hypothetical protein